MIVAKITESKAKELKNKEFSQSNYFNPIQDVNGNWVISLNELAYCVLDDIAPFDLINYEPIINDEDLIQPK